MDRPRVVTKHGKRMETMPKEFHAQGKILYISLGISYLLYVNHISHIYYLSYPGQDMNNHG